jgi:hypothetical protein
MLERLDTLVAFATVMLGVSLLITILNQMIASLFGYRATYMKDGIKDLLGTLDPDLVPHLETIVNDVLTHKLASDSVFAHQPWAPGRWKMASTIRPEELTKLLSLVSRGKQYAGNIDKILSEVNPTLARQAELMNKLAPVATAAAGQLMREISSSTTTAIGRLEAGFNSTMDRVRQRFTLQMRIWTIVFSAVFAFAYHMDAKRIYSQLSTDPALRASLSSVSNDLMKTYTEVNAAPSTPSAPMEQKPAEATAGEQTTTEKKKGGGEEVSGDLKAERKQPAAAKVAAENDPTPEGRTKDLDERTDRLSQAYRQVRSKLTDSNLALFEVPRPWYHWKTSEIFGILAMTAFLSLGAPFWYNTLKNLVNLRSQVAQKQQQESMR